jgi:hypothetical protein
LASEWAGLGLGIQVRPDEAIAIHTMSGMGDHEPALAKVFVYLGQGPTNQEDPKWLHGARVSV